MPVGAQHGDVLAAVALEGTAFRGCPGLHNPIRPPALGLCGFYVISRHAGADDVMGGCLFKWEFPEWRVVSGKEAGRNEGEGHFKFGGGEMASRPDAALLLKGSKHMLPLTSRMGLCCVCGMLARRGSSGSPDVCSLCPQPHTSQPF